MPATPEKNAYDILGVPRTASLDEIKKRYRELARQYHPDVNQNNPAASRMFADVTTAYKTLSDANSRRTLDAEIILQEERVRQASNSRFAPPPPRTGTATTSPRPAGGGNYAAAVNESLQLTTQAQAAFARGKFVEARSFAEQALRINRRNAVAYEVLGDVFRLQGKTEEAMNAYSMSLQINPRNTQVMQRLERVARASGSGPTAQRVFFDNNSRPNAPAPGSNRSGRPPSSPPRPSSPGGGSRFADQTFPVGKVLVGTFGYGGVLVLLLWVLLFPGDAPRGVPLLAAVSTWNTSIVTIMSLCGLLLGATMTITTVIRRIDDELIFTGIGRGGSFLPLGALLVVLSLLNFYVAAALYTVVALVQESLTPSLIRVFVTVVGVVLLLGAFYEPGHLQVLLWGGNIVFLTFLTGWFLGDFFRPDHD